MLNKQKGNMYPWVTHTWNAIKGRCPHDCFYCYMKRPGQTQKEIRLDESELKIDLGMENCIFCCSGSDMWAKSIPEEWIIRVLHYCAKYDNRYLFQSKNPARFLENWIFPEETILATTIETNRLYPAYMGNTPSPSERKWAMTKIPLMRKTVTIEPIMDFDLSDMIDWIKEIQPEFVSIGADSGNNHLPEPSGDKIKALTEGLKGVTEVKVKDNLKRILR